MKIIYHHRTQADSGDGVHIGAMIEAFKKQGHSVEVLALVKRDDKQVKIQFWQTIARFCPRFLYELLELVYNFWGLVKILKKNRSFKCDFIYERYSLHNFAGILAAQWFKIPLFLEVNSPLAYEKQKFEKLIFKGLAQFTERQIFKHAKVILAVSDVLKRFIVEMGIEERKIFVIHNGVDLKQFNSELQDWKLRTEFSLNEKIVIGFCGFFKDWHNVRILLEVVNEIKKQYPMIRLILVGDGPAKAELEEFVDQHDLRGIVYFTGRIGRDKIANYVSLFDIAILPSIPIYASPLKLFEYMAMEKAIIAPRQINIEEILVDNVNALLVVPNNKVELRESITRLVSDPKARIKLSREAKLTILKRGYVWEENCKRVVNIYQQMFLN